MSNNIRRCCFSHSIIEERMHVLTLSPPAELYDRLRLVSELFPCVTLAVDSHSLVLDIVATLLHQFGTDCSTWPTDQRLLVILVDRLQIPLVEEVSYTVPILLI